MCINVSSLRARYVDLKLLLISRSNAIINVNIRRWITKKPLTCILFYLLAFIVIVYRFSFLLVFYVPQFQLVISYSFFF